ncbi:hypothetical protein Ddye_028408 [Dipteronia dyeriana]|uniref:Uncharacterized protein n=1 Tax=Dipteronia dyeriana TaxID=168575 RepID=A0AAD9TRV6_9ROSI|nr:hypothetical protein Ddye_028408 [Dipteronia dyeriana]
MAFRQVRNQLVNGKVTLPTTDIYAWAANFLKDFRENNRCDGIMSVVAPKSVLRWSAPSEGLFKINTYDALRLVDNVWD